MTFRQSSQPVYPSCCFKGLFVLFALENQCVQSNSLYSLKKFRYTVAKTPCDDTQPVRSDVYIPTLPNKETSTGNDVCSYV